MIPFNKPHLTGKEIEYITKAVENGKIAGDGAYTRQCERLLERRYGYRKCMLTSSGTDALEMAAILTGVGEGDEVIMPSFTHASTANAFVMRGAHVVFADSYADHPCIDAGSIESLVTPRTKVIVAVHYAGIACDMDAIRSIANKHQLLIIEDCSLALDSYYKKRPLGGIGHMAALSFHESANVQCGEGGMLVINDEQFIDRADIIWQKGTNLTACMEGKADRYQWLDIGSSFMPSDIVAAFLLAQLESMDEIQAAYKARWEAYYNALLPLEKEGILELPKIPKHTTYNWQKFFIISRNAEERQELISALKARDTHPLLHYQALHNSPFYRQHHDGRDLPNADRFSDKLLRLPYHLSLTQEEIKKVAAIIRRPL